MSKRLQILIPEKDYRRLVHVSKQNDTTVSEWVRNCINIRMNHKTIEAPEKRLAKIMKYARYNGPSGSINQILKEIDQGTTLPSNLDK